MVRIEYNTKYDAMTGNVIFTTECPALTHIKVGSDDCVRCKFFRAITMKQQVECGRPVEDENLHTQNSPYVNTHNSPYLKTKCVSVEAGGFSTPSPCNLSSAERKPVQTKIQFK
jgi:hypothetical protein